MTRKTQERIVTMKDVARRAGVSQATVSYVINGSEDERIGQATRDRVFAAARLLGYRPNVAARSIRTQQSNLIGFVTDTVASTPFAGAMIKGAQDAARAASKILLLINTEGHAEVENTAIETLLEHRVEGIVYATMYHRPVVPPPGLRETEAVLLDCYCEDRSLASVVPDEVTAGRTATEALIRKGHRRIGLLNNSDDVPAASGRLAGYRQALAAHQLDSDPALIQCASGGTARAGYEAALALLSQPDRPTAVFCFNDPMAMGAYDAIRKLGLTIPDDIAVIGFDNHEVIAPALHPGLCTMQLPHYEMGQWAVRHLLGGPESEPGPVQRLLDCPYIERESI